MTKAYWIGHVDVHDMESYRPYMAASGPAVALYGGRFIVRGGRNEVAEGQARGRHVVVEFPSYEQALACFHSPEYEAARKLRQPHSTADIVIIEGYEG